ASDSFIGLYIAQLGGTESLVGVGWFVGVMSEAVIFATAGWWFRKYRPLVFVILAGAIYAIRWFLYAAADQSYQVIIVQVFHGLFLEYCNRLDISSFSPHSLAYQESSDPLLVVH